MTYAVVNYERMKRLEPPKSDFKFDFNMFCIFIIILTGLYLYKRHVNIRQSRELYGI